MQTSFIPKKTYAKRNTNKKNYGGLMMGIATAVFVLTILATGVVFLYNRYLESEIEGMSKTLEREKGSLEKEIIKELSRIDKRINASVDILNKHMTLVSFFEMLEKNTLQNVRFGKLDFLPTEDGWELSMEGSADSYSTIALQSDVFEKDKNMSELIFSGLGVGSDGGVVFKVNSKIDPLLFSYRSSLE
jgi:lipopolysaccharide export LptBFGC system permease protein LptF